MMKSHRRRLEELEHKNLVQDAALSGETEGRKYAESKCEIRTDFQRDRDRIIHSKAFRRLKHKTQVFIAPEGDHYRTRLTHTLEVAQIARTIAKALHLNEDLTEAIALGHDLGHTPFGHSGEEALAEMYSKGFKHNHQSLRVVDLLEDKSGAYPGLNLTLEVRDGILTHTGNQQPKTLEGEIVRIADRIAYINHDIDDALRAEIISTSDLPEGALEVLGRTSSQRIDRMVKDIIKHSWQQPEINRSQQVKEATEELRQFLYNRVYVGSKAKTEEDKAKGLLKQLYTYYNDNPEELPQEFKNKLEMYPLPRIVVDYIAGMSDRYALKRGREIFLPRPWLG
ncbi:deoxyguanosinetriphosphate triphosphohydrolase [Acetohalobium arabaticum]|uniref:Deoxyguanosinetriphosphate triphosphohydrolase-like protein n=1 Tax=Acetohalobium arabaticum (strain ATCC 49924 / DSM 5501 / Z-7288) TaxID=574087 RepID=D9QVH1_ACEAZ|nr:deoxyguanosinetriphosphate triphosphohydrolase [Acetohalobium arabaticum]ADL12230.1 deoxyguanosinetriphosphate triphosphohydrolase [Acetohalobium arabaticum DSM 5501]